MNRINFAIFLRAATVLMIGVSLCVLGSCQNDKHGSGQYDSLFLGFHFGMERQAFFDYCWEMNKQRKFSHGPGNRSVAYKMEGVNGQPVLMEFYPSFHKGKIYEMPVTFSYEAWAPWNKAFWADSLLTDMYQVFRGWYGDDDQWKIINHPVQGKVYARMDGTRRINLFRKDDQYVQAVFTDLRVEKAINDSIAHEQQQTKP